MGSLEIFDTEKWCFYLDTKFITYRGYIFNTVRKLPTDIKLEELSRDLRRASIERAHNEIDLSTVASDINKQRELAIELWNVWRNKLNDLFPSEELLIELYDMKEKVKLTAYGMPLKKKM